MTPTLFPDAADRDDIVTLAGFRPAEGMLGELRWNRRDREIELRRGAAVPPRRRALGRDVEAVRRERVPDLPS